MKIPNNIKFLFIIICIYACIGIFNPEIATKGFLEFINLFIKILPYLLISFILIFIVNYLFDDKKIKLYLESTTNIKKYTLAIILGIISTGPIYVWYPFLSELRRKGVNNGLISVFIYNRAIKLQLLPLMIFYFSIKFALIITCLIIIFSLLNSIIINKILPINKA